MKCKQCGAEIDPAKFVGISDARRILAVSDSYLRRAIAAGEITAYRLSGRRDIRFVLSDLESLLEPVDVK